MYLRITKIQHEEHLSPSNRKLQKIFSQATLFFDILPNHLLNVRCAFPQAILPHIKVPEASGESVAASSHIVINDWRELRITALKYPPRAETSQQEPWKSHNFFKTGNGGTQTQSRSMECKRNSTFAGRRLCTQLQTRCYSVVRASFCKTGTIKIRDDFVIHVSALKMQIFKDIYFHYSNVYAITD